MKSLRTVGWLGLLSVALLGASRCIAADWPTFGGSASRGAFRPDERLTPPLSLRWVFQTDGYLESSPAVVKEVVYIGCCDGFLYALEAQTGRLRWKFRSGGAVVSSPSVDAGVVYIGCNDGNVYAVGTTDGKLIWQYATAPANAHAGWEGEQVKGSPALHGGRLFVGNYGGKWLALKPGAKQPTWAVRDQQTFASPAADGDRVVFASLDGIACLDVQTGRKLWEQTRLGQLLASPVIAGQSVYAAANLLLALDRQSGKTMWQAKPAGRLVASPSVTDRELIVADVTGVVRAIDRSNGKQLWEFKADHGLWASPAVAGDTVVVASTGGMLELLSRRDGRRLWRFDTKSPIYSSPAIADGTLVVANESGYVMAFGTGRSVEHALAPREPRDLAWASSFPVENCFWELVGTVESFQSKPMATWLKNAEGARYRQDRGDLIDFLIRLKVERGGATRHDLNTSQRVTIKDGESVTICSRPPTTYNNLHVSPTQRDVPVDWLRKPRVRIVCSIENPLNPLVAEGTRPFCAYLVQPQPPGDDVTPPAHWPVWHHNNWIHFTPQIQEKRHADALAGFGLEFVGWRMYDERVQPRYFSSRWWRDRKLYSYAERGVDFYRMALNPKTRQWWAISLHTEGVCQGERPDESLRYNKPPTCRIVADTTKGRAPLEVQFKANAGDTDGRILWTTWDFDASDGIGIDSSEAKPRFTFTKPGRHVVSLTAMDNGLLPAHAHLVVTVQPK